MAVDMREKLSQHISRSSGAAADLPAYHPPSISLFSLFTLF